MKKVLGTAVHPVRYEYGARDGYTYSAEIKLNADGSDAAEAVTNCTDIAGRHYRTDYSDGSSSQSYYNAKGQLKKQVDPDGVTTLYRYNGKGEVDCTETGQC